MERGFEFGDLCLADVDDAAEALGIENGVGGQLHDLKPVECLQERIAGDDHAVVFHDGDRVRYVKLRRHFIRLPVDLLIRQRFDIAQENVALRNGSGVEFRVRHGKGHGVNRVGKQNRAHIGMLLIDFLVQQHGAGRRLAELLHAALDADKIILLQIRTVEAEGCNEEAAVGQADGIRAVCGGEQAHFIRAVDERDHVAPGGQLLRGVRTGDEIIQLGMRVRLAHVVGVLGQGMDLAELAGQHLKRRGIVERFKALERREHIRRADANAVVFQQRRIAALRKDLADLHTQRLAAGNGVGRDLHLLTDMAHGRDQIKIGQLADDGECHERGRVRVQHGVQIRAHTVDRFVERQLGRGLVRPLAASVRADADDILAGQRPLVDPGRGDPDVFLGVADGKIAAGHGGQALVIDALHEHDKLVGGMDILNVQKMTS